MGLIRYSNIDQNFWLEICWVKPLISFNSFSFNMVKSIIGVEEVLNKSEGPWGQRQVELTVFIEFILSVSTPHPQ